MYFYVFALIPEWNEKRPVLYNYDNWHYCLFIYVVCLQIESKISARRLNDLHSHFGQVTNPSIYSKEV